MKGILGKKVGMTQVFTTEGKLIPVTVVSVRYAFVHPTHSVPLTPLSTPVLARRFVQAITSVQQRRLFPPFVSEQPTVHTNAPSHRMSALPADSAFAPVHSTGYKVRY